MQKAACYIRVSTNDQTEFSPDAQLKAIKKYAENNNILLDDDYIFVDEGISGRKADKRPAFQQMIKIAKSKPKKFDVILVHKFDRFARSREDSVVYKSLLKKECNIRVVSITESIEDDKFSVILEAMLEAMAEYYSLNLSDEVKKGMTEKATRGQYQSTPPFGYKMETGVLSIVEDEAKIVSLIFQKFVNKEMNKLQIAKYINNLGYRTHRGNEFENRTIEYILTNPVYIGYARWTPTGKLKRGQITKDTIIEKSQHKAIVSEELFKQANELLQKSKQINKRYFKSNTSHLHWLNGLVRCKLCGCTLVRNTKDFYQCNGYAKGKCAKSQLVKIGTIEKAILDQIQKDFTNNININVKFGINKNNNDEAYLLLSELEKLKEKEHRIKEAYMNGIDTLEEYKENKNYLETQRNMLNTQLKKIKDKQQVLNKEEIIKEQLKTVYNILIDEQIDMERKYEVSHMIIDRIDFLRDDGVLELTYKV